MVRSRDATTARAFPREAIPRLTERFYRVDVKRSRERGGTGLGLAIVKHIVNRHQGRLQIESQPGQGSSFTVSPAAAGAGRAKAGRALLSQKCYKICRIDLAERAYQGGDQSADRFAIERA